MITFSTQVEPTFWRPAENVFGGNFVFPEQFWNNPTRPVHPASFPGYAGPQNFVYQQFNLNLNSNSMPPTATEDVASILQRLMPVPMETSRPMKPVANESRLEELPHLGDLPELDELDSKALGKSSYEIENSFELAG